MTTLDKNGVSYAEAKKLLHQWQSAIEELSQYVIVCIAQEQRGYTLGIRFFKTEHADKFDFTVNSLRNESQLKQFILSGPVRKNFVGDASRHNNSSLHAH